MEVEEKLSEDEAIRRVAEDADVPEDALEAFLAVWHAKGSNVCEGCRLPALHEDVDGVPLCGGCMLMLHLDED